MLQKDNSSANTKRIYTYRVYGFQFPCCLSKATSGGKKKANKQKKTVSKTSNIHQVELLLARCQQHISGGLYKLIIALNLSDMLPTTGTYPYDDEQVITFNVNCQKLHNQSVSYCNTGFITYHNSISAVFSLSLKIT